MSSPREVAWELGSDFAWPSDSLLRGNDTVPWTSDPDHLLYLESGRQALALVSGHLRQRGFKALVFPSHYCESMITPFIRDGWEVQLIAVDSTWRCVPPDRPLPDPAHTLIFSMSYFGVPESPTWLAFLNESVALGARVLSDETHRLLEPGLAAAHFRVGSLRKLVPVPDGAFLAGVEGETSSTGRQGAIRRDAMRVKATYLAGELSGPHLPLYAHAESVTEADERPARMSVVAEQMVSVVDYEKLAEARMLNHAYLEEELTELGVQVTTGQARVPSHAVISLPDVRALRTYLTGQRIYCPIHWPVPPKSYPRRSLWRDDVLSIPIDHRYSAADMERVVSAINDFVLGRRQETC